MKKRSLLAAEAAKLPNAEEIGAELEKFLRDPGVAGPAPQEGTVVEDPSDDDPQPEG